MEHLHKSHRHRSVSSSSSSSPDVRHSHTHTTTKTESTKRPLKQRAMVGIAGAVARHMIKKKLKNAHKDSKHHSTESKGTSAGTKLMMLAVAKQLLDKQKSHKHKTQLRTSARGHSVDSSSDDEGHNSNFVKSIAMNVYPMIRTQVETLSSHPTIGKYIPKDSNGHPVFDKAMIMGIASVANNIIRSQVRNRTSDVPVEGHHHGAHGEHVVEEHSGNKKKVLGVAAGVASAYLLKKAISSRKHKRTLTADGKAQSSLRRRSVSYTSDSSSDEEKGHGGKVKNALLTSVAAGVARSLVTKMNRRRERKTLRREERVTTEPSKLSAIKTKLAEHRARSSSSSSSSSDEDTHNRKKTLLTTATGVASHLMTERLHHRKPKYTEDKFSHKLSAIPHKLTRTHSDTSSEEDVEEKEGFKHKALTTAATLLVQQLVKKAYRKTYTGTQVQEGVEKKRHTALRQATGLAATVLLKKALKQRKHKTVKTVSGTEHVSKSHRHRSASSSSSSSSDSDTEGSSKKRKLAVLMAATRVAKGLVQKGHRRAERKTLRRQVLVEKDASKLDQLKAKLAAHRAESSSSSSSSSDEETHKKKAVLLASAAAVAAALLKKRYDARRTLYTEEVYTQKVGGINNHLAAGATSSLSDDEGLTYAKNRSVIGRAQSMVAKLTRRGYRQQYPRTHTTRQHGNTWVKLNQGLSLGLLGAGRRRHHRHGHGVTGTTVTSTGPVYTTGSNYATTGATTYTSGSEYTTGRVGLDTGLTSTGLTSGVIGQSVLPTHTHTTGTVLPTTQSYSTTSTVLPTTTSVTTSQVGGVRSGLELIDAAVKVKRHGLTHLTYQDLGYFVTLRVDHSYLINQGHIKAGDKIKALLRLRDDKVFSLDRIIDEPTKLAIKESLGLNPLDDIRLEYVGAERGTSSSSSSDNEYVRTTEPTYVTASDARLHNVSAMDRLKSKLHRHHKSQVVTSTTTTTTGVPTTGHVSMMDKVKGALHGHHTETL